MICKVQVTTRCFEAQARFWDARGALGETLQRDDTLQLTAIERIQTLSATMRD